MVTAQRVKTAIKEFKRDKPAFIKRYGQHARTNFVRDGGQLLDMKPIWMFALNDPSAQFHTHEAWRNLKALGFDCVLVTPEGNKYSEGNFDKRTVYREGKKKVRESVYFSARRAVRVPPQLYASSARASACRASGSAKPHP